MSIGVATCPDDAYAHDELLDKADWAMYAAKRAGRNRVLRSRRPRGQGDLAFAARQVGRSAAKPALRLGRAAAPPDRRDLADYAALTL